MTSQQCTLPIHSRTGLQAVGIVAGKPVWPIKGGAEVPADPPAGNPGGDGGQGFVPPASQAEFDRAVQDRLARQRAAIEAEFAPIKAKAAKHDELELELSDAATKLAAQAAADERTKATEEWSPRLVRAEFKAAAAEHKIDKAKLADLIEDINFSNYLTDKGEVDEEKVAKKVALWAPPAQQRGPRDLGQGQHDPGKPSAKEAGIAEAKKRFGAKTAGAA